MPKLGSEIESPEQDRREHAGTLQVFRRDPASLFRRDPASLSSKIQAVLAFFCLFFLGELKCDVLRDGARLLWGR